MDTPEPELSCGADLRAGLREVVAGFRDTLGFDPAVRLTGPVDDVPSDVVRDLRAVLSESLANVAWHARASSAEVVVTVTTEAISVQVTDDGIGCAGTPRDGGLADLRRRAVWHGGTLGVESGPAGGTRLTWTVPRRNPATPAGHRL
jgi:signal transduction histidine kinase